MISLVPAAEPNPPRCKFRKLNLFRIFNSRHRGQMSFDAAVSPIARAEGLLSNGLAE